MGFVKCLLVGCIVYLSSTFADASLARVTSVATSVVEQTMPVHAFGRVHAKRYKREVVTKFLDDPRGCIRQCQQEHTDMIMKATISNMAKLVALSLQDLKGDEFDTPEKEAEFKKRVQAKTIANMGPFFDDLCAASEKTDDCYSQCPKSQLRKIHEMNTDGTEAFCEPSRNWDNFTEYWDALNCTNSTELEKPCENKCGREVGIHNVTHFDIEDGDKRGSAKVMYEADADKNAAAAGPACKTILCNIDCYKPIMSKKCGVKAYNLYARMSRLEPRSTLRILKEFDAVGPIEDCKEFQ